MQSIISIKKYLKSYFIITNFSESSFTMPWRKRIGIQKKRYLYPNTYLLTHDSFSRICIVLFRFIMQLMKNVGKKSWNGKSRFDFCRMGTCNNMMMIRESMYQTRCATPKLLKFQGRPKEFTPKARIKQVLGQVWRDL